MKNWYIYTTANAEQFVDKLMDRDHVRHLRSGGIHIVNLSKEDCQTAVELLSLNGYGGFYGPPTEPPTYFEPVNG
jgi:hypothetical protein